ALSTKPVGLFTKSAGSWPATTGISANLPIRRTRWAGLWIEIGAARIISPELNPGSRLHYCNSGVFRDKLPIRIINEKAETRSDARARGSFARARGSFARARGSFARARGSV